MEKLSLHKNKDPVAIIKDFLSPFDVQGKNLLLGYSGGGDSQALLYILLELQKKLNFHLHLAHVDHGWRKESAQEAEQIKALAHSLQLPVYVKRLEKNHFSNAEDWARKQRYLYFSELCKQYNIFALLLAHHADDVAETFIQRIVEGADLPYLGGMQKNTVLKKMAIWRPMLSIHKKNILLWLEEKILLIFTIILILIPSFFVPICV